MKITTDLSLSNTLGARVTAAHLRAVEPVERTLTRSDKVQQHLESYRAVAVLLMCSGSCYASVAIANPHLLLNTLVQVLLSDIQNMVSLFFVLAGAISFLPLVRALLQQHPYPLQSFLVKRVVRLLPVYAVVTTMIWLFHVQGDGQSYQWLDLLEHLACTQIFDPRNMLQTIGPAWILALEVWFCLFLACFAPLIHLLAGRWHTQVGKATVLCSIGLACIVGGLCYTLWLLKTPSVSITNPVLTATFSQLAFFGLGMLLAVVIILWENGRTRPFLTGLYLGTALMLSVVAYTVSALYLTNALQNLLFCQAMWAIITVCVCLAVIVETQGTRASAQPKRLGRLWQHMGVISYGMLLWYEPLLTWFTHDLSVASLPLFFLGVLLLLLLIASVASFSYWLIEYPASFLNTLFTCDGQLRQRYEVTP